MLYKEHSLAGTSKPRTVGALFRPGGEEAPSALPLTKESMTMQDLHLSTHRLRCSQPQPAAPLQLRTDDRDTAQELLCYVSVLPAQVYDPRACLINRQPEAELM